MLADLAVGLFEHHEHLVCAIRRDLVEDLGVLGGDGFRCGHTVGGGFREDDLLLLESLSGPVAVAVEKATLASRLKGSLSQIKIIR